MCHFFFYSVVCPLCKIYTVQKTSILLWLYVTTFRLNIFIPDHRLFKCMSFFFSFSRLYVPSAIRTAHYVRFLEASLVSSLSVLLAVYLSKTGRQLQLIVWEHGGIRWHEKDGCIFDDMSPNCTGTGRLSSMRGKVWLLSGAKDLLWLPWHVWPSYLRFSMDGCIVWVFFALSLQLW